MLVLSVFLQLLVARMIALFQYLKAATKKKGSDYFPKHQNARQERMDGN